MVFSSVIFLFIFLPLVLLAYYALPGRKAKNIVLLVASLFFYFWGENVLILVLLGSVAINYICGLWIAGARHSVLYSRLALAVGVALNLALLGYFKYFDFVAGILNATFNTDIPLRDIILPIGISFFTFQGMTYIIDLYRDKFSPQKNPLKLCLYIALFPPLIAGPILRYDDIGPMIDERQESVPQFTEGISRFICGLAKKVLIANNTAVICDAIFMAPVDAHSAAALWVGAIAYAFQIYFDFSGYSDMAIGLGLMFGFRFKENFDHPYASISIREFWRRWHISLSSFFRDYLYIPLGGNRHGIVYVNLLVTFFATGLWHGANYTFIVWGLWHGLFIVIENILRRNTHTAAFLERIKNPFTLMLARLYTLLVVLFGWVLFRSDTISYAWSYMGNMALFRDGSDIKVSALFYLDSFNVFVLVVAALFSAPLAGALRSLFRDRLLADKEAAYAVLRIACLAALLLWSAVNVIGSGYNPFIYFRF
ncbi:MAG: MBOAT family protein [Clostridiales bacterium]|nr:MBOAT family protein [Clostridiales bacterium]